MKTLKEQVVDMVNVMRDDQTRDDEFAEAIRDTYQAYGIIAEKQAEAKAKAKGCDTDIAGMLKTIAAEPEHFIGSVTSLYNSAIETAAYYLLIARDSKHIIDDLFDMAKTPIEKYAEELTEEFEETEEN